MLSIEEQGEMNN